MGGRDTQNRDPLNITGTLTGHFCCSNCSDLFTGTAQASQLSHPAAGHLRVV